MVNGASRRSHASKDELRGKPTSVGAYAGERLSLTGLGKALQGKPRSKPESGNPTFRDCRGAPGNVTLSFMTKGARLGSIPTRSRQVSLSWMDRAGSGGGVKSEGLHQDCHYIGPQCRPPFSTRCSKMIDVDDCLGKCLRSFLGKVVPDSARNIPVFILANKFLGV